MSPHSRTPPAGKYTEVHYDAKGNIRGSSIRQFLLEKSRLVYQQEDERNYHIFYEMLVGMDPRRLDGVPQGMDPAMKKKLVLSRAEDYHYLRGGNSFVIDVKNDQADFDKVVTALQYLKFEHQQEYIFQTLSAILHLGNIQFSCIETDRHGKVADVSEEASKRELNIAAQMLEIEVEPLMTALRQKIQYVHGETIVMPLSPEQALDTRDALFFQGLVLGQLPVAGAPHQRYCQQRETC